MSEQIKDGGDGAADFQKGVLEGLSIAATACDSLVMALDGGGNEYRRPANAEQCASAVRSEYAKVFRTVYPASPKEHAMNPSEAAEILRQHNAWRRNHHVDVLIPLANPFQLGKAIDVAVDHLDAMLAAREAKS